MRPVHERGAESVLAKMGSEHGGGATQRIALRISARASPFRHDERHDASVDWKQ